MIDPAKTSDKKAHEWRPIEELPPIKGALSPVYLCAHENEMWVRFGRKHPAFNRWYYSTTTEHCQFGQTEDDAPTHFMPLPKPPVKT